MKDLRFSYQMLCRFLSPNITLYIPLEIKYISEEYCLHGEYLTKCMAKNFLPLGSINCFATVYLYEGESVNRSQIDIKHKTCDI
jgi:hypothetical protein